MLADLLRMEAFILDSIDRCHLPLAKDVVNHLIKPGGKKIRPKLFFVVCKMLNYTEKNRFNVAAAIESIHNATLLHDDVLDDNEARHGIKTANKVWGNKASILAGDFLLTLAFRWLIECENVRILSVLSEASHLLVNGEIKQMSTGFNPQVMRENYFNIIQAKTASLFSACCEAAAILSHTKNNLIEDFKSFGFYFGIAFQIIDDILDYTTDRNISGKKPGKDFYERKITLPAIIAYERGSREEQKFWEKCFNSQTNENDFRQALAYIQHHNAIHCAREEAQSYVSTAENSMRSFFDSANKAVLIDFLRISIGRRT